MAKKKNKSRKDIPRRHCDYCGTMFKPTRDWHRFHRPDCRRLYWKEMMKENMNLQGRIERLEKRLEEKD